MPTHTLRILAAPVAILAFLLALFGCGSGNIKACNAVGGNCCGLNGTLCPLKTNEFLYATGLTGQVSSFIVDNGTGALSAPTSFSGPTMTLGMAGMAPNYLYVSDFQTPSVDAWQINPVSGLLTVVPGSPFLLGPLSAAGGIATAPNQQVVYVGDAGKIDAFSADATGALTALPASPFPSGSNIYLAVDPSGHFLFSSAADPPGEVFAFTIDSTGALTDVPGSPFATIPNFVGSTNPSEIVVDSTGNFVYVGLLATGQVAAFSIVPGSGALNPVPGSPFPAGNVPLALVATGNFLYVSNAQDGTLSGYSITPVTGVLVPLSGSPFAIHAGALATDPYGLYLYTNGSGGMLAFSINSTTGGLTPIGSPVLFAGATALTLVQTIAPN